MKKNILIAVAIVGLSATSQTFQTVDNSTLTTGSVYYVFQEISTNIYPQMTNDTVLLQDTNHVNTGESFPTAFGKINSNFQVVSNYMATNAPGTGANAANTNLSNISTAASNVIASIGGSQTPWVKDINGNSHALTNASYLDFQSGAGQVRIWGDQGGGVGVVYIGSDPIHSEPYGETYTTVLGGDSNDIGSYKAYSTIVGGLENVIGYSTNGTPGNYSFIAGGVSNSIYADNSFLAGQRGTITNNGVFLWNDGATGAHSSQTNNQFSIWAANGLWVNGSPVNSGIGIAQMWGIGTNTFLTNCVGLYTTNFSADVANAGTNIYGGNLSILGHEVQSADSVASAYLTTAFGGGVASGSYASAFGQSTASGVYSFAAGGGTAVGQHSFTAGSDTYAVDYGTALGFNALDYHNNSFVWSDGTAPYPSTTNNQFSAYAANGFRFDGGPITVNGQPLVPPGSIYSQIYVAGGFGLATNYNGIWTLNNNPATRASVIYTNANGTKYSVSWALGSAGFVYEFITNTPSGSFGVGEFDAPSFYAYSLLGQYATNTGTLYATYGQLSVSPYFSGGATETVAIQTNIVGPHGLNLIFVNGGFNGTSQY